jgi:hypothetical protein
MAALWSKSWLAWLSLTLLLCGGTAVALQGAEVLMIGADPDPTFGDDGAVFDYLTDVLGHDVTYLAGADATSEDGESADLVVISSTLPSGDARSKFVGLEVPILNWEEALMDGTTAGGNFAMGAGSENGTADPGTQVQILNAAHPLAAGLSGTVELASDPIPRPHVVGPVAPGVISVAAIPAGGLGPVDLSPSGVGMHIGSSQTGASPFTGLMDEIGIWDRSLSFDVGPNNQVVSGEVHTIFSQGIPALGNVNGMIGYWSFDDTDDEFTALDGSNAGNDALLDAGATKVTDDMAPGVGGTGALLLDGAALVNVPNIERPGGELAYSFWFKADPGAYGPDFDTSDPRVDFFYGNGEGGTVRPHLSANRNGRPIGLYVNSNGDLATPIETTVTSLTSDQWHHVVITWDGETGSVFIDGALSEAAASQFFAITAVDVGGELTDGTLATQRVVNFPIQDVGFASLTDDGLKLFDAAIDWLLGAGNLPGDFNSNGVLDAGDLDDLTAQSATVTHPAAYDLTSDSLVDATDVGVWVKDLYNSWIGDANLDGEFNSSDLVGVLASGTYEADVDSVWSTGDFNGDGRTNSGDLVAALADGGYESGPRAAVAAVPEPSALVLVLVGLLLSLSTTRRR